ncbi:MAG: fasciclin domain-containing protein [Chloroflexota bacterium]
MRKLLAITALLMLTAVHFHTTAPAQAQATGTITEVLRADPNYSVFIAAAEQAGLADDLDAPNRSYTVFAPPDDAMLTLLDNLAMSQAQLFSDRPLVRQIVQYHILGGELTAADISQYFVPQSIFTFSNQAVVIGFDRENTRILLNNGAATVVRPNTEVRNGIIHFIDTTLIPPGVEINVPAPGASAGASAPAIPPNSIPDIANRLGATSFVRAITAAGLVETLAETPNLTVFVPRNGAFDTLQSSTGLTPEAAPASVLTFHVSPQALNQFDLANIATGSGGATLNGAPIGGGGGSLTGTISTLNGTPLRLQLGSGSILLNNGQALVTNPNIGASNGIIHIIDNVLIP